VNVAKSSSGTATTGTVEPAGPYRGRFAPSPSGPLHFGSLVAALASFLEARTRRGEWLLRIEDLDPPRERPGAADAILTSLDRLGLHWDGAPVRQSTRTDAYVAALERLAAVGLLRECACSRTALAALNENESRDPGDELFHPPECLAPVQRGDSTAIRLRVPDRDVEFVDRAQGACRGNVDRTVGDFVLRRRDGYFAYQLAVVVDDAEQAITDVVRGMDLLSSTPRQILLQQFLGLPTPTYLHVPLAVGADGRKLSKSEDAPDVAHAAPAAQLCAALAFLRQDPPAELSGGRVEDVLQWARVNWRPQRFAGLKLQGVPAAVRNDEVQDKTQ
jgi:glutamyl-Q tRNA(Asp) synthetase